MIHLPTHIFSIINDYASSITTIILYKTCKDFNKLLEDNKNNILSLKNNIYKTYHIEIINLLGGIRYFLDYPVLKWNDDFLGSTGYIDRLQVNNVTNRIMRGIDSWGRPFVTLRLHTDNTISKRNVYTCTLFQRYTDINTSWTHSTIGGPEILVETGHFMRNGIIQHTHLQNNMNNLLNNKGFIYRDDWYSDNLEKIEGIRLH